MKINPSTTKHLLKAFDFQTLFREQLGWDNHHMQLEIAVDGETIPLHAVAEKRGFVAYVCPTIPDRATRLKLDRRVTKFSHEHFIIYTDQPTGRQVWQWVRHEPGKPMASREHRFDTTQSGDSLIHRLEKIAVTMEEEENINIVGVAARARAAFDVDKVTKRFYDRFKEEHAGFMKFIAGIAVEADLQWYTSLMLNRLMFTYFMQKKGFLDGDVDYLKNRLAMVREARGQNKFQSFYQYFLLRLFHDGLGKAATERHLDPAMEKLLGKIPYLNGGFFEVHQLEERNPAIDIPDQAFEKLFTFFDQYSWNLDERPLRDDREINPDVVGYIFEKYINQKQMGAYYTKEDITEYISKNTIIPFLFDAAEKKCAIAFKPDSALWRLLRDDPDRYIYDAVKHGVVRKDGDVVSECELPDLVQAGMHDPNARMFNKSYNLGQAEANDPIRLVTETWREYVGRRTRCLEIREKLRKGEVHQINDLITLNLDTWQFARDAIINSEGPELLRAFWYAIEKLTVLDPTCGSGAFLFAALRILETLYSDCLESMEKFIEDLAGKKHHPEQYSDFRNILAQIAKHPNDRYFIFRSIIINNLFGVDIMEEAVEICKLRLFLKLAAQVETFEQIEPLPDIDFNIRAGNTLVGYATLGDLRKKQENQLLFSAEEIKDVERTAIGVDLFFTQFKRSQTDGAVGPNVIAGTKTTLRESLTRLAARVDRYLAGDYKISPQAIPNPAKYEAAFAKWKSSHQPFHWFAEFYGIMGAGGFDVIIGNPPYIAAAQVRKTYLLIGYETSKCSDIYANVQERCVRLSASGGRCGMIVPLSAGFSGDFQQLRSLLYSSYSRNWFSSFGRIPAALFSAEVRVRNTIHLGAKGSRATVPRHCTTVLHRWFEAYRPRLMATLSYATFDPAPFKGLVPKINTQALSEAFTALTARMGHRLDAVLAVKPTKHVLYFKKSAYNWLNFCRAQPPCFDGEGHPVPHTKFGEVSFSDAEMRNIALLFLNGKIMFAYWCMVGDDFDVTRWMFADFPFDLVTGVAPHREKLLSLSEQLIACMLENVSFKLNAGKRVGNYNLARCRHITDTSDAIFAEILGLSDVMEDIELMYSQVVKTDFSLTDDAED